LYVEGHPDKDYILGLRDKGLIVFHDMEPLVQTPELSEKINTLMNKYRRNGTLLSIGTPNTSQLVDGAANNETSN
jgi:hypothetical protein